MHVIQWRTPTPIEAILRCSIQTPVRPSRVLAETSHLAEQLEQQRFDPAQVAMQILTVTMEVEQG